MRGWAWKKKKPIYIYIYIYMVYEGGEAGGKKRGHGDPWRKGLRVNSNESLQLVPTCAACHFFVSNNKPSFFFFWLVIIRRKKKARWAKDNSRLSGGFNFLFLFVFLIPLGNLGHFVFIHSSVAWGKPSFISNARPFECPI